uniref:Conserved oligomeric Golgi complex subunit 3 n=1 Tax=Blastobotrys adeninivorans TaxID=409370 RepID=A0A060TCU1_BLAAD
MFDEYSYAHVDTFAPRDGPGRGQKSQPSNSTDSKPASSPRRPRGRSILQMVATDVVVSQESSDWSTIKVPPRRAKSLDRREKEAEEFKAAYETLAGRRELCVRTPSLLTPITDREARKVNDDNWHSLEQLEFEDDNEELMDANNFGYIWSRDCADVYARACEKLMSESDTITELLDKLSFGFSQVKEETAEFENTCNTLVQEHNRLSKLNRDVDHNLDVFNRLERATRALNAPGSNLVTKDSFTELLQDLDAGLKYVEQHPSFKDIDLYKMRYSQCMTRALTLAQSYFSTQIHELDAKAQRHNASMSKSSSATQTALLYASFENEAPKLKKVAQQIAERAADNSQYQGLFSECLHTYFNVRQKLLNPIISKKFEELERDSRNIVQMARSCLSFYKQLCDDERNMFQAYFNTGTDSFMQWLGDLCDPLYDVIRQRVIRESSIDNLCELTSMLLSYIGKEEETEEVSGANDETDLDYSILFEPILHDVQARLVFRVRAVIKNDVEAYEPMPEDLGELGQQHSRRAKGEESKKNEEDKDTKDGFNTESFFVGWYPPMRKAVTILSQIYQLVQSSVFDDLAHRIVHECVESLQKAQNLAVARLGPMEGQLFLIKHLLILTYQIGEFDIENAPAETYIDFSGIQELFKRVRQEGVAFSVAGLLSLARESVPKVINNMMDAKEELYAKLKNAINGFTEEAVKRIASAITGEEGPQNADQVKEWTRNLRDNAATELPRIREVIQIYVEDERTIDILIDSIQDLVIQTYQQFLTSKLDKVEFTAEDRESLMDADSLQAWLGEVVSRFHSNPSHD